jgi:hypothetical protein
MEFELDWTTVLSNDELDFEQSRLYGIYIFNIYFLQTEYPLRIARLLPELYI